MRRKILLAMLALALGAGAAHARDLNAVGISVGNLANPFFVALVQGATDEARRINPNASVQALTSEYVLQQQINQIDRLIQAKVDVLLVNAADPLSIATAVRRAEKAGIVVIGVDTGAARADAIVQTDNRRAGAMSCQYLADRLDHKGAVIIQNGPRVSSVFDRVYGCKTVLAKYRDIRILSDDEDAKATLAGGKQAMLAYLKRFPKFDGLFAINDPEAIGADEAARQAGRTNIIITSVDGSPEIVQALKHDTLIQASAAQSPNEIGRTAIRVANDVLNGKKPAPAVILLPPELVTRENVAGYKGW